MTFAEMLSRKISSSKTQLCLGLDPHPANFSKGLQTLVARHGPELVLMDLCHYAIDAAANHTACVKFQMSFFEYYGAQGYSALKASMVYAKSKGLCTILDAKRGDISTTMQAYGHMAYEELGADALTVLPYMGLAVIDPLKTWLRRGRGVYVVWVSSNPEGWAIQARIYQDLLRDLVSWADKEDLRESMGLVLGSTKIGDISEDALAEAMNYPLLLPGFGAQGASMTEATKKVMRASKAPLFPISRGLLDTSVIDVSSRSDLGQAVSSSLKTQLLSYGSDFSTKT